MERPTDVVASRAGLRALSLAIGVFLFCMGARKLAWLTDSTPLVETLRKWLQGAPAASRWYIETLAIPGAPLFAPLVALGELAAGAALACGILPRLAAGLAFFMILNFHLAAGVLFQSDYLTNGYGLPVLGSLLALALDGARLPLTPRLLRASGTEGGRSE